jgi:hypothetical protein
MNWKGSRTKQLWHNLRYHPRRCQRAAEENDVILWVWAIQVFQISEEQLYLNKPIFCKNFVSAFTNCEMGMQYSCKSFCVFLASSSININIYKSLV